MRIRVLCFAGLADGIGLREVWLEPEGPTVQHALDALVLAYPQARDWLGRIRVARNETYCPLDATLSDGDTLALIPPVSGG